MLEGLDDLPGVGRGLARQVVARQHDADDAARRVAHRRPAAHELASAFERLRCVRLAAAARNGRREVVSGGADARRQARRLDGDERHDVGPLPGLRTRPVHFDQPDAALRDLGIDRAAHDDEVARLDRRRGNLAGDSRGVAGDTRLPVAVVVLRDFRGRPKDVVDRLAEPLLGAAANQLAADDEHEDAWHEREPEEREDEFGPEP